MTNEEREQKIQEAIKKAEPRWDALYSQADWPKAYIPKEERKTSITTNRKRK
jgi:hypothetical protein